MKKIGFWLLLVFTFTGLFYKVSAFQQPTITGKVVMVNSSVPMNNVKVSIGGTNESISNEEGSFIIHSGEADKRPDKVSAVKRGFEIANWEFENGNLTIFMRKATFRTLNGTMQTKDGLPASERTISLIDGNKKHDFKTDIQGHFETTIPYSTNISKLSIFKSGNSNLKIKSIEENKDVAYVYINLELGYDKAKTILVKVLYGKDRPARNMIVSINKTSYITGNDGTFRAESFDTQTASWDLEGQTPLKIESPQKGNIINIYLPDGSENHESQTSGLPSVNDTTHIAMDSSEIARMFRMSVSEEVNKLLEFYNDQSREIEKRNNNINHITDSLSLFTKFDEASNTEFLTQLEELNRSIEITSNDFSEIKENSLTLIKRLRAIMLEQEEIIQEIEVEKAEQEKRFKRNLMLVISFFGIAACLLIIAIFIAKRLNVQKKVIESIKNQLSEAQALAKIGSMTYDIKKKQAVFSEYFFDILRIKDENRIRKIKRSSAHIINPELLDGEELERVDKAFHRCIDENKPISMEIHVNSDKRKIYVELKSKLEFDDAGNPVAVSSTFQDISEKKEREILLLHANKEAAEANKVKEQFLSTMSHEIRTPLNAIIGLTDQLIKNDPGKHQIKNLNTLQFSGEHLLTLVNDILDYNKIQAGKIELEQAEFNLRESLEGVLNSMSLMANDKGIKLNLEIDKALPEFLRGDKFRLNQVLTNLISNGIKFTEKGSVGLSVGLKKEYGKNIVLLFSITDTGIGIANHRMEKIFEGFEQEDASIARKYGGTGLGLAISKQLVSLLGGDLKVNSELKKGSEFYFTITFEKCDQEIASKLLKVDQSQIERDLKGIKILCVDDNEVNQLVISQYFNSWKINATYADSGNEAIEAYHKDVFDLVFLDIRLPDMNGYEVAEEFIKIRPEQNTPIVALTAEINEQLKNKIHNGSMISYLSKPFTEKDLKRIISMYALNPVTKI